MLFERRCRRNDFALFVLVAMLIAIVLLLVLSRKYRMVRPRLTATSARLYAVWGFAVTDSPGNLRIAEMYDHRMRSVPCDCARNHLRPLSPIERI